MDEISLYCNSFATASGHQSGRFRRGPAGRRVSEPGAVFYSTLTQPADFDRYGVSWWYVGPRNGHNSIFTRQALALAWARHGFKTAALNDGTHLAFRTLPPSWGLTLQS
jgi:hypothetical protein